MTVGAALLRRYARPALGSIRLFNGAVALVAPQVLIGRVSPGEPPDPAAVYAFRMFGIRTILLGWDLFAAPDERTLRRAVVIHGTDVATAAMLGVRRRVPARTAVLLTGISAVNTVLAWSARESERQSARPDS